VCPAEAEAAGVARGGGAREGGRGGVGGGGVGGGGGGGGGGDSSFGGASPVPPIGPDMNAIGPQHSNKGGISTNTHICCENRILFFHKAWQHHSPLEGIGVRTCK